MTYREKLYENAGIEPIVRDEISVGKWCYVELKKVEIFPPFTAEKELKLIKWFMHKHFSYPRFYAPWVVDNIASHINFLWEVFTKEEQAEIKEILECISADPKENKKYRGKLW